MKHVILLLFYCTLFNATGQSTAPASHHHHFYLVGGIGLPGGMALLERALSQDVTRSQEVRMQWTPVLGFSFEPNSNWSVTAVWGRTGWKGEGIEFSHKMGILTLERHYLVRPRGYFYSGLGTAIVTRHYYVDRPSRDLNNNDIKLVIVVKPIGYAMDDQMVSLYVETGLLHTAPVSAGLRIRLGTSKKHSAQ